MRNLIRYIFITLLVFSFLNSNSQEWVVADDIASIQNPSPYTLQNVNKGKELYLKNCKSCHGDAGKNNALPLVPIPPDVTSAQMHANSEGALFHKITAGRGTMPQFETSISEDDRWRIVNYIMNFNPANEPLLVDAPKINAKLLGSVNEAEKKVEVLAEFQDKDGIYKKLANTPVFINSKKTFGKIKIGQATTDENGRAVYQIPETVVGDAEGKIDIIISMEDNYTVNELLLENAKVCAPNVAENLFDEAVLWGTNDRLQPWLLVSYLAIAVGAWLAIFYVVFQIVKIKRLGKE